MNEVRPTINCYQELVVTWSNLSPNGVVRTKSIESFLSFALM